MHAEGPHCLLAQSPATPLQPTAPCWHTSQTSRVLEQQLWWPARWLAGVWAGQTQWQVLTLATMCTLAQTAYDALLYGAGGSATLGVPVHQDVPAELWA
jgi:hypothetical protein